MSDEQLVITEAGFLSEFFNQHTQRTDRPFCFILGAGVSRSSGIRTGAQMAEVWLREVYEAENFDGLSLEEWATAERLGIKDFQLQNLANFYPQLYRRRYGNHEQAGYAFLESQMEGKEPSYGYSVLSYLLSETPHRVVVTTNFDNLVADALSIHSSRFPLVIGHDALAQYAAVELRRPLVAKIHGALGFSPKSQPDEISNLAAGWQVALKRILDRYTPIVIGYEGNDGSLMGFLNSLPPGIPDNVFWCVYAPGAKPIDCLKHVPPEVQKFVWSRAGRFVPIPGFDQLMAKLLTKLREKGSVPDLYERLKERARQRERSYDEQQRTLFEASVVTAAVQRGGSVVATETGLDNSLSKAVSEIAANRKDKPWWIWLREAQAAPDANAKQAIDSQAHEALSELDYAQFLDQLGEVETAGEHYKRVLSEHPNDALSLVQYARYLINLERVDEAEDYFRRALDAAPGSPFALLSYANFLRNIRKQPEKARELEVEAGLR
jgi:tetratricopeptide (TPR) repeat protein